MSLCLFDPDDTIAAIASAPSGAARGVIRMSGAKALSLVKRLFEAAEAHPKTASRREPLALAGGLHLRTKTPPIPAVLYRWHAPATYTRQELAELHLPGSPPLVDAVLSELIAEGARLALPPQFAFRAFLAGRIDLTQAEALLGIISAQTARHLRVASDQYAGGLSK